MWFADNIDSILYILLIISYWVSVFVIITIVILENRNPLKSISWVLILLLLPILGIVLYVFFGQNLRRQKIIRRKGLRNHDILREKALIQSSDLKKVLNSSYDALKDKEEVMRLQLLNSYSTISSGNKLQLLIDGKNKFKVLLEELCKAQSFIHIEYYIFELGEIGNQILAILEDKAKNGVEVRMIVDDVGSWELKSDFFNRLKQSGIEAYSFLTVRFPTFTSKVNYRNHRKIVVIDGKVGFLGGINVADRYVYGNKQFSKWRDTHLKIEGNAVDNLQTTFSLDWYFVSRVELKASKYYPKKEVLGNKIMQITQSGPDTEWPAVMMGFFKIISTASNYVYISSPYFLPNESVLMALKTAAMGGVDVRIIMPEKSDATITLLSSRSFIKELMQSGVRFFFYKDGFIHAKMLVSDDVVSSIGSANMDFRSFDQNFEVTSFVYDKEFALEVKAMFKNDFESCYEVELNEWINRPIKQKAKESFARLLSPLL